METITNRIVAAVNALSVSESKYRLLFQTMAEGWFLAEAVVRDGATVDWRLLEANPAFEQLFRVPWEPLAGQTLRALLPDMGAPWLEGFLQAGYGVQPVTLEGDLALGDRRFELSLFSPKRGQVAGTLRDVTLRRRIEAIHRCRLELFSQVFQAAPLALGITTPDTGEVLKMNQAAQDLLGGAQGEGLTVADLPWKLDPADQDRLVEKVRREGQVRDLEAEVRHPDQSRRWASFAVQPMELDGRQVLLSGVADLTLRKRAEADLQAREHLLDRFVQQAPVAMAMFDRDLRYLFATPRWLRDYRLDGLDLVGMHHYDVFPEIPPHWKEIHARCLEGATETCEEEAFHRKDGSVAWIRWAVRPWHAATGEVGGLIMFTEALNDRKAAEAARQASEARARRLFENAPVPFASFALPGGRTLAVNRRWQDLLRYDPSTMRDFEAFLGMAHPEPRDRGRALAEFAALLACPEPGRSQPYRTEHPIVCGDGRTLQVQGTWLVQGATLLVTYRPARDTAKASCGEPL